MEQSTVRAALCLLCVLLTAMALGWLASRVHTLEGIIMQNGCLAPAQEKETTTIHMGAVPISPGLGG